MELRHVMRTTPATREWRDEPVPDDVLYEILDTARFAPSGGNRQAWRLVVVKDGAARRRIGELYGEGVREYESYREAGRVPFAAIDLVDGSQPLLPDTLPELAGEHAEFAARMGDAPVLMVLLADLSAVAVMDVGLRKVSVVTGASLYPFVQNVLLAARDRGYGGVMTTVALRREPQLKELLGVPDGFAVAGVIALGRPAHEVTKLRRNSVESFTTVDRFDGVPLTPAG